MSGCWIVERPDGAREVFLSEPDPVRDAPIARFARARRLPSACGSEDWSFTHRRWVTNADRALALADRNHLDTHGANAIDYARLAKAMEARQLLAGVAIDGIVAAEAAQEGVAILDLARTIVAKADAAHAPELARIAHRSRIRADAAKGETS